MDIYELNKKINELNSLTKMYAEYGSKYAQAEHDYKVEVSKEVMRLKADGQAATLINLIVYGQPQVAKLRLQRDLAEVMYNACTEQINSTKLVIKVMESQLKMDYFDR